MDIILLFRNHGIYCHLSYVHEIRISSILKLHNYTAPFKMYLHSIATILWHGKLDCHFYYVHEKIKKVLQKKNESGRPNWLASLLTNSYFAPAY